MLAPDDLDQYHNHWFRITYRMKHSTVRLMQPHRLVCHNYFKSSRSLVLCFDTGNATPLFTLQWRNIVNLEEVPAESKT